MNDHFHFLTWTIILLMITFLINYFRLHALGCTTSQVILNCSDCLLQSLWCSNQAWQVIFDDSVLGNSSLTISCGNSLSQCVLRFKFHISFFFQSISFIFIWAFSLSILNFLQKIYVYSSFKDRSHIWEISTRKYLSFQRQSL